MKEVQSSYKEDKFFLKDRESYKLLADKVTKLHQSIELTKDLVEKITLLKDLLLSLTEFNDHLSLMIEQYPDYYKDMKYYLDELKYQNQKFYKASEVKIKTLRLTIN